MSQLIKISLISLIVANNCLASPTIAGASLITKGTPSPYDGVLLTKPAAQTIYYQLIDYDKVKLINTSFQQSIELYKKNEDVYLKEVTDLKDQNQTLETAVQKANDNGFWIRALYFGLGVVTSGLIVYAAQKH